MTIRYVPVNEQTDLVSDLLAPIPRTAVVPAVRAALGVSHKQADRIVQAFDDFVAKPLEANLKRLHGRDLAKRNPMIYTESDCHTGVLVARPQSRLSRQGVILPVPAAAGEAPKRFQERVCARAKRAAPGQLGSASADNALGEDP